MANELNELLGPILKQGNSKSNLSNFFRSDDAIRTSKSFGIVGAAAIDRAAIIVVNDNEPVAQRDIDINNPIVKMINALAVIDAFLKQNLDNQNIIANNEQLTNREAQIENKPQEPEIEVVKPDAEKVDGSGLGLLALGGLGLLAFDPVQNALKEIADGVVGVGKFVTDIVKSINSAFHFLFNASPTTEVAEPSTTKTPGQVSDQKQIEPTQQAVPIPPASQLQESPANAQMPKPPEPAGVPMSTPEEKPSFFSNVASGAAVGATAGAFIPRVGAIGGAIVGGAYGAIKSVSGGSAPTPSATTAKTETAKPNAVAAPAMAGEIPKNDIVALGNYLASKGADKSQMEHLALSGRVGDHAPNSRHKRGMAIDVNFPGPNEASILDTLEPQLRAAGYNTIWRKPGHTTHMHVSVGGPEGAGGTGGGDNSLLATAGQAVASVAEASIEQVGKLFGVLGSAIIKPGVPRDDIPNTIGIAARKANADIAVSKTPKPVKVPSPPSPPKLNRNANGPTQNPATAADKTSVYYYLRRFGYQDINEPQKALTVGSVA